MRLFKLIVPGAAFVALAGLPVLADGTGTTDETNGVDNAIARIEAATTHHIDVLTALLAKVPAQAQPGIQRAIDAAQDGHDKALAALGRHEAKEPSEPGTTGSGSSSTSSTGANSVDTVKGSKPGVTGLMRARDAVTAAFQKSVSTLQGLIAKVPAQAAASIQEALARVEEHRSAALQNLDNLIAGQKPGHPTAPDRPARADRPDRPDRPDRAERPTPPERPVRPEHPQVPARP
jgi:hypothetical protein